MFIKGVLRERVSVYKGSVKRELVSVYKGSVKRELVFIKGVLRES